MTDFDAIADKLTSDVEYEGSVPRWFVEWGDDELAKAIAAALKAAHSDGRAQGRESAALDIEDSDPELAEWIRKKVPT